MKSIMLSIQPKQCEKIAKGEQTIIVKKSKPKLDTPFKCYIYCTRANNSAECLLINKNKQVSFGDYRNACNCDIDGNIDCYLANGYVIGEFTCDRIDKFTVGSLYSDDIQKKACLSYEELIKYFYNGEPDGTVKFGYGWHISDLKIYDKPKELSEFGLTRPFQSWGYVEEL